MRGRAAQAGALGPDDSMGEEATHTVRARETEYGLLVGTAIEHESGPDRSKPTTYSPAFPQEWLSRMPDSRAGSGGFGGWAISGRESGRSEDIYIRLWRRRANHVFPTSATYRRLGGLSVWQNGTGVHAASYPSPPPLVPELAVP